jgi:polysaccharide deacetylase family protein (PEP-CTERM system associated)
VINLLTIDVEEWFHTTALDPYIGPEKWAGLESRVMANVRRVLQLLDVHQVCATFFVLGWVAERYPELVREIATRGHEIASHGYRHRLVYNLSPSQFREYVNRSKKTLEDLIGSPITGYRATSFSIVKQSLWALDILREIGFSYDSSIYPIGYHDLYGIEGFPRYPYTLANGLIEIPPSTLRLGSCTIPLGGGGYLRLYPYWLTQQGIRKINREGHPVVVYLHPWELDSHCPRIATADFRTRFRQYINLHRTESRLKRLLADFRWGSVGRYFSETPPNLPLFDWSISSGNDAGSLREKAIKIRRNAL